MQKDKKNWIIKAQVLFLAVAYVVTQLAIYNLFTSTFTLMIIIVFNSLAAVYALELMDTNDE